MFEFGKESYNNLNELTHLKISGDYSYRVYYDVHGRKVVYSYERYPCFDSFDYLYEDRGYHYYYVKQKDGFACLYYDDGLRKVEFYEGKKIPGKVPGEILEKELTSNWLDRAKGFLKVKLQRKNK